jgi:hypothetical protein
MKKNNPFRSLFLGRIVPNGLIELLLMFFLMTCIGFGQEIIWKHTYVEELSNSLYAVQQTADSGYVAVGSIWTSGMYSAQLLMIKTNHFGNAVWTKTYGGYGGDLGLSIKQTLDGGYIVSGTTTSFGSTFQIYLLRTNSQGDTIWTRTYGGSDHEGGPSVDLTSDGGFIIAGFTYSYGAGDADVYLIKTDSLGEVEWTKTYGGAQEDMAFYVEHTIDGGYIVAGETKSFSGMANSNMYLIKTDSLGDTLWTKSYFPYLANTTYAYSCQQTSDSGYILSGFSTFSSNGLDYIYLVKTDSRGDSLWTKAINGAFLSWGTSVKQTPDGGYVVVGFTEMPEYNYENRMFMFKTTAEGDTEWTRIIGDENSGSAATAVALTSDGNYIVAGGAYSASLLLKISPTDQGDIRGDLTGDDYINISDVVYLVNYLFRSGSAPHQNLSADANCDGMVDLGDLIYIINYLYRDGPKPGCLF